MDHPRHYFFSHSAFAADEYRNVHRRDLQNLLADLEHLRAGREERQILRQLLAILAQRGIFRAQFLFLPALEKCGVQLGLFKRLGQVVQADRFHYRAHLVRTRQHDDVQCAVQLHQLAQGI